MLLSVFVHYTAITAKAGFKSLAEGEEAEYEIVRGPKGFQAANVTGPGGTQVMGDTRSRAKSVDQHDRARENGPGLIVSIATIQ